jgi:hypothetical protein
MEARLKPELLNCELLNLELTNFEHFFTTLLTNQLINFKLYPTFASCNSLLTY